jgi:hypothetical protein
MCGFFSSENSSTTHILFVELEGSPAFHVSSPFSSNGVSASDSHHLVSHWQPNDVPPTQYGALGILLAKRKIKKKLGRQLSCTQKIFFNALEFFCCFKSNQGAVRATSLFCALVKITLKYVHPVNQCGCENVYYNDL